MRTLKEVAQEIRADWYNVNYAAEPYLNAMSSLTSINESYFADSGTSIVTYFLANASMWRGEKAREIKKELKEMLNERRTSNRKD